jgi:diguanylate cyclase (GGDEF)-like protein
MSVRSAGRGRSRCFYYYGGSEKQLRSIGGKDDNIVAKANILLVEDNKVQASLLKDCLEKSGYHVVCVGDGMSAFKAAKTHAVDIILLDRILPDMDGSEVCRWLKLDQSTRDTPIIMLTAKGAMSDRISGLEAGADDYLPKPFDDSELNVRIFARLRTKTQQDELKKKNRQLEDMLTRVESLAIMDPLTGIYNRRRFENILTNEFKRAARYQLPLTCMMIDIDNFKLINDAHGHQEGDAVIKEIARIIQTTIREVDTPARWGGEEFVVLSPNTSKDKARLAAERVRKAVAGHEFTRIETKKATISIGIAGIPDPSIDSQDKMIHAADLAMYEAKKNGRNRVESA